MSFTEAMILVVAIVFNAGANVLLKYGMQNAPDINTVDLRGCL